MRFFKKSLLASSLLLLTSQASANIQEREWLAGDHHVHTHWSVGWDHNVNPPAPIKAGDAIYSYQKNARTGQTHGLSWIVNTDHGGPNHSNVNYDKAYPELVASREAYHGLIQFYGIELDTPAGEHSTVIIPVKDSEHDDLHEFQRKYSTREVLDAQAKNARDTVEHMSAAVRHLDELEHKPLVFINHPARTAKGLGQWGDVTPEKIKTWHRAAPKVLVGMEGAPGHQADFERRGSYNNYPTMGGFDQMTAVVGGLWDHLLGAGNKFWISANSDAHSNVREGGNDFFPGEYSKTYVHAQKHADDILDGLRHGRVFVTTGDLINSLDVQLSSSGQHKVSASMGETLVKADSSTLQLTLAIKQSDLANANGDLPRLERIDVIMGAVNPEIEKFGDNNPTTEVIKRIDKKDFKWRSDTLELTLTLPKKFEHSYVRLRGTNTQEIEPLVDKTNESPWQDLWFYSNPIFW